MQLDSHAVAGGLFLAATLMLWLGWLLLPHKVGAFFQLGDFAHVHRRLRTWLWLFRVHLFGHLMAVMALVALASFYVESPWRVVIWPAVAVLGAGLVVACLASAFYYHFAVWGALDLHGKHAEEERKLLDSLHVGTHYITCLVRFGRVFFGLGQVVLALGLWGAGGFPAWFIVGAALLGVAAMALTMGLPDDLHLYRPVFHLNSAWLMVAAVLLLSGSVMLAGT
jgi:hypothetical protein